MKLIESLKGIFFNKNLGSSRRCVAFTLAEILITLGIIGVVASLTIPTLVKNYQKEQTVTQLKKAFSTINQVFQTSTAENGFPDTWDFGADSDSVTTEKVVQTYIIPYLSIQKDCGYNFAGECTRKTKYNMKPGSTFTFSNYQVMLRDGTVWSFSLDRLVAEDPPCIIQIQVDLNGDKKPNVRGKDVFFIQFQKGINKARFFGGGISSRTTLLNGGSGGTNWGCNKTNTNAGIMCGALIQYDGWQIKDDYLWD